MLRPEKMSLLEIAIHKTRIPQFLIEVPKHEMHIKLFEETEKKSPHHLRRGHFLTESTELDEINQKINEIEDNIIYYFQNFQIEPDNIEKPDKNSHFAPKTSPSATHPIPRRKILVRTNITIRGSIPNISSICFRMRVNTLLKLHYNRISIDSG